jgi:hypothetical protein
MKKMLLFSVLFTLIGLTGFSQNSEYWATYTSNGAKIATDKAVARKTFPTEFKLFALNIEPLRQKLFTVTDKNSNVSTIISLPNAEGGMEQFEVVEGSNFEPALQAQFPQIRAFNGKGVQDRSATLKISISPAGIQTMIFRTDKPNEFIEPYSQDHNIYAVFVSNRNKGKLAWACSTEEQNMMSNTSKQANENGLTESSDGNLRTYRLAQSCNGEYANFFGASTAGAAADQVIVLAAFNATLTRCNGVYEKDLAMHLNLVASSTNVIYYNPATDPYSAALGAWNQQLQLTLNSNLTGPGTTLAANNAAYDIGHMFGATGGGGNAGCIGCICTDAEATGVQPTKGKGITSPADGIPQGDNFDIDYVVHEVGHQIGGNHTFSMGNEGSGVNKEVGSGITIMGYAGITAQDVAPHSIDIFHQASITQIQANLGTKSCGIVTPLAGVNATPVVAPVANAIIPKSTPFTLTGAATDANAADVLTYCWEQNDNGTGGTTGVNSVANPTKAVGPNWLSFPATTNPTRTFPRLSTVLAGNFVTGPLPGGDAGANIEALSSIGRALNFRLTVRDNANYVPVNKVAQTAFTDVVVTVDAATGPFLVTSPNTPVSWFAGSSQTITWDVAGTTGAPINCANVKISFSNDGGLTFPTVLAASTANDGSEMLTMPTALTTTARIKIEAVGNIFFDISNTNFSLTTPPAGFSFGTAPVVNSTCPVGATVAANVTTAGFGGFTGAITLAASSVPAGTTVTFGGNPVNAGNGTTVTLNNANTLAVGSYVVNIAGTGTGITTQNTTITFNISGVAVNTQPAAATVCNGATASFSVVAAGPSLTYQWQSAPSAAGPWTNVSTGTGATTANYITAITTPAMNGTYYRAQVVSTPCATTISSSAVLLTVNTVAVIGTQPAAQSACIPSVASFNVAATGTGLTYQWQSAATLAGPYTNITGATAASYTTGATALLMNGTYYRVSILSTCSPATPTVSNPVLLTASSPVTVSASPTSQSGCVGDNFAFNATANAPGNTITFQWQSSTTGAAGSFTNIAGATGIGATPSYAITAAPSFLNGYWYRVVFSVPCGTSTSTAVTDSAKLTLSFKPAIALTYPTVSNTNPALNNFLFTTVSPANVNFVYNWTKNNAVIPNTTATTQITLPVDDAGTYTVSVRDAITGCTSNLATVTTNAATSDNLLQGRVFVYPNPVSNILTVRYNTTGLANRATSVAVYDEKGALVFNNAYPITGTLGRMQIDMSRFRPATYMVYVVDADGKKLASTRVIKQP